MRVNKSVGSDYPVAEGSTMGIAGFWEDVQTWGVGGGNVGVELVERGVEEAELGEGLYDDGAKALVAVFVGDDDADGGAAVDRVVVVEFDATHRGVGHVVGVGVELEFARGE